LLARIVVALFPVSRPSRSASSARAEVATLAQVGVSRVFQIEQGVRRTECGGLNRLGGIVSACSGSRSPSAPSPAVASAATQLTISGNTSPILSGQALTLSAVATLPNGSTQIVSASWQSSSPPGAVVANGVVTWLTNGSAVVNAQFKGLVAQATVQVIQSYVGTWAGD
jgi:hypothetical protein